jgi:hypothetical protein
VAIIVIAFLVWRGFVNTKGNHLAPVGKIGKVRTLKLDDKETLVVLDFNVTNDSDRPMVVRTVEANIDGADGSSVNGGMVAAADLANVFRNYPELERFNSPLKARDVVAPHQTLDRMVGIRFDVASEVVENRKRVVLRIEDVTGPVAELTAK